jgi:anti-sigma B factor antagonist
MSIRVQPQGDAAVVTAERRLVVGNRQALKAAVISELDNGRPAVVIDFRDTELIDSGGLGVLVTLYRHAEDKGARFVLANLSDELTGLMRLTKLDTILTLSESVETALGTSGSAGVGADEPQQAVSSM